MEQNMLNKILLSLLLCLIVLTTSYSRTYYHKTKQLKGQKYYLKRCASCHGSGKMGGNLYSIFEWQDLFENRGKELLWLHKDEKDTQETQTYIKSSEFKKESKYILRFIQEFAYDSDTIPTCN